MDIPESRLKPTGLKPEWANLPARRCDNCGKVFKPKTPTQRFHNDTCRFQAKNLGPGYARLKVKLEKDLRALKVELETALAAKVESDFEAAVRRLQNVIRKRGPPSEHVNVLRPGQPTMG